MTSDSDRPRGIAGVTGVEPVGAVLTIGIKGADPRSPPTETDRFHIVLPHEDERHVRPLHPAFAGFNRAAQERRVTLAGNLVHATRGACFEWYRKAQVLPRHPPHPAKAPHCVGDGVRAVRWTADGFHDIECPNERCEFAVAPDPRKPPPCKPWMRFLFRPRWATDSPLPAPLMKFTSGAWNTTKSFVGFFDHIEAQVRALGIGTCSLYGLPFTLTLSRKTRSGDGGRAFPVVSIAPDGDLLAWIAGQRADVRLLALPVPLTDPTEQAPEVLHADWRAIQGPDTPGDVP